MSNSTNTTSGYAPFDLYPYNPSQPPAYAFLGLFGVAAIVHLILMIPYRVFFPFPMVIGCAMEAGGYYMRSMSHDNVRQTLPYIIQYLLIFVSPPMLAAMIYMSPGRILHALHAEDCSIFSPRWQAKLFVLIDMFCFATQFAGTIMSDSASGPTLLLAGLVVQVAAFALFIVALAVSHKRLNERQYELARAAPDVNWRRYYYGLYTVSGLFLVRNFIRIIEQNQGSDGAIYSTEAYLYIFDAVFIFAAVVVMIILHPGKLVRTALRAYKAADLENELAMK
ncbi:hypothetical protein E8E14_006442 [Neopestalotiopsis sp. 37M]|nr:hypothetical protein E8E14_006442 [Neopestalotiopsis sp. 37M]